MLLLVVLAVVGAGSAAWRACAAGDRSGAASATAGDAGAAKREPSARAALVQEPRAERLPLATTPALEAAEPLARELVTGAVVLADGTPVSARLHAVRAADPRVKLGETFADDGGRFQLALDDGGDGWDGRFALWTAWPRELGQNDATYAVESDEPLRHVLPGGALEVRVAHADGRPASGLRVLARFAAEPGGADAPLRQGLSDERGASLFYFRERSWAFLSVEDRDAGTAARAVDVLVEPGWVAAHVLVLAPLENPGRLRVEVVDQDGVPMRSFAVRIEHERTRGYRLFVDDGHIGPGGLVENLALGPATVTLAQRYSTPPHVYTFDESLALEVEIRADQVARARFVVRSGARLAIDLRRASAEPQLLDLRLRRASNEPWTPTRDVVRYHEDGATFGSYLQEDGRYHTEVLAPGVLEVELVRRSDGESVWSTRVELTAGAITVVEVTI